MKNAREIREPLAWTVIVVSIGFLVAFVVRMVLMLTHDHSGLFGMARSLSGTSLGIGMILLLLAAVLVCRFIYPATPRAELLGKVAAVVIATAAGLDLILALLSPIHGPGGAFGAILGLFGDLLAIAVKVLAAWVLLVLTRPEAVSAEDDEDPGAEPEGEQDDSAGQLVAADEAEVSAHDDDFSWPAGVGAVWTRAGDAASGAEASSWDNDDAGYKWTAETSRDEPGRQA
ncbi:hypothetical protein [Cutibacterium namnetense]|uniref:hypothetical protein n=1 Tax=Cutibacterium namnetense TaxID=1574624 RepID=UPI0007C6CD47|nr:hypothetical protein [Cutibacterium namnetense]TKW72508.1 MAG: hypothetical protein DI580_03595 [Cutibacterium acnes]